MSQRGVHRFYRLLLRVAGSDVLLEAADRAERPAHVEA